MMSSLKVPDGYKLCCRSSCPHPSSAFGMSGFPISSAPFMRMALIRSERGSLIPSDSLRYCLVIAAAPAATGVAMDDPFRAI